MYIVFSEFDKEMDDAATKIQKHYREKKKNKEPETRKPEKKEGFY